MVDNKKAIIEILQKAFQIEVEGYTFYSMAADRAEKLAVQELFGKLAKDEMEDPKRSVGLGEKVVVGLYSPG